MRQRKPNLINEAFQSNILRLLFYVNDHKHINLQGKLEDPLSVDGANFARAFPIQWDKLTAQNISFIADSDLKNAIPPVLTKSLNGKSVGDNSADEKESMVLSRYNLDSVVKNADHSGTMKYLKERVYRKLGDIMKDYQKTKTTRPIEGEDLRGRTTEVDTVGEVCEIIRDFLNLRMTGKEDRFISDIAYNVLTDWENVMPNSVIIQDGVRTLVNQWFKEHVSGEKVTNKGVSKYPVKQGVHYERFLDHDYLGQYNNLDEMKQVPVEDFKKAFNQLVENDKEVGDMFDKRAKEALNTVLSEYEKNTEDGRGGYLKNGSFVSKYNTERFRQFRELPELDYVSVQDKTEDTPSTGSVISKESDVLRSLYRQLLRGEVVKRASEVYKIITEIYQKEDSLGSAKIKDESSKTKAITQIIKDIVDEDVRHVNKTGDFSLMLLLGANLQIRYVISSVYVDPVGYNTIGTYNSKYVYGWYEGLPLTTVTQVLDRRMRSVEASMDVPYDELTPEEKLRRKKQEKEGSNGSAQKYQHVNCNVIDIEDIEANQGLIHCAVIVKGTIDKSIGDDELSVNKYIMSELGEEDTIISRKRTKSGTKGVVSGNINSVAQYFAEKGIPVYRDVNKNIIIVDPEYYGDLMELAELLHIDDAAINEEFDRLDDLYADFNIFLDNAMTDKTTKRLSSGDAGFDYSYYELFMKVQKDVIDKLSSRGKRLVGNIINIDHIRAVIDDVRQNVNNPSEMKIGVDKAITEELNALDSNKVSLKFNSVFAELKSEIDSVLERINDALKVKRVDVRVAPTSYATLGQNMRGYAAKVNDRYESTKRSIPTDRERLQKAPDATMFGDISHKQQQLESVQKEVNAVRHQLTVFDQLPVTIKQKSGTRYTAEDVIRSANQKIEAHFTNVAAIKDSVHNLVMDAIRDIRKLDELNTILSALKVTGVYIDKMIDILEGINSDVAPLQNDVELDSATDKIDTLAAYFEEMMKITNGFRKNIQKYGIYSVESGPGE
jgi:hypothetical protein